MYPGTLPQGSRVPSHSCGKQQTFIVALPPPDSSGATPSTPWATYCQNWAWHPHGVQQIPSRARVSSISTRTTGTKASMTPQVEPTTVHQVNRVYCGPSCEANKSIQHSRAVQPCKPLTTFHSYSELPLELKFMIWEHTLPTQSRVIELKKASSHIHGHRHRGCIHGYAVDAWPPTPDAIKVALVVDRASRALVFRNYVPLKLGLRVRHFEWYQPPSPTPRSMAVDKWLIPGHTVFMSERLGDTVVARSREVLVFPYRPARHGLDTVSLTYVGFRNWDMGFADGSPDTLSDFFEKWWACLPQQQDRDSSPVGWEAEIDFWNSTKEHDVPYVLEFKGRKPGACRRLDKNGR